MHKKLPDLFGEIEITNEQNYFATAEYKDWLSIPDGFEDKKGNIIKYALRTEKKWLNLAKNKTLEGYIASVDVALVEGQYYKITGVTRKGLWEKGLLNKPQCLTVCVYSLERSAYADLINILYPISLKNKSQDNVLASYQRLGLSFNSDRLRHGYITEALNIALRGEPRALQDKRTIKKDVNTDRAIEVFINELLLIDSINPNHKLFTTGILAAALISVSLDHQNIEFFKKLNNLEGETKDGKKDPIESLLRIIESLKKKTVSEGKLQVELCAKTMRAIQAWNDGPSQDSYWFKRLTNVDFLPDIRKMKTIKGVHADREL